MNHTVVDLFCGCGGLSRGMQDAGLEVLAGYDSWKPALAIYADNNGHPAHLLDLSDVDAAVAAVSAHRPDVIAGGPPCQDFSSAGKRDEGARADLTPKYARIVSAVRPRAFIMENVSRAALSDSVAIAIETFKEAGYGVTKVVLDASKHGAPQLRKRMFVVGALGAEDGFLDAALQPSKDAKRMTMRDYFGGQLDIEHYYRHPRSYKRRAIYSVDEPSATIRGVNRPKPANYAQHANDSIAPDGVRALTTFERSRIQTFPADYRWEAAPSASAREQMIGNAVPVALARHVGATLKAWLDTDAAAPHFLEAAE